jgi:ABC-type uncharacterized transport system permease subunit
MYPNPALPAWELAIMAIVPVMALAAWLATIYLAARDTRGHKQAAAGSSPEPATAGTGSPSSSVVSGREPGRPPADRAAA